MIIRRTPFVVLVLALAVLCAQASETEPLETVAVESRTVPREYRLDGLVEAINRATVSAQVNGQVQGVYFDVHDQVEKGGLLLKRRDTEYRAGVTRAQAEVQSSTAELKQKKEQYESATPRSGRLIQASQPSATWSRGKWPAPSNR